MTLHTGGVRNIGVVRCLVAAVLFGATAPLASSLAASIPTFTMAGLLYLGAAIAVAPTVAKNPPASRALLNAWRPIAIAVVVGGAVGPVLLVAGLARTNAASASLLLNTELAATVVLAALVFREHLGVRVWLSAAIISVAAIALTWNPGAGVDAGGLLIVAACVAWGIDNGVTATIDQVSPEQVVLLKGLVAGGANLVIGVLGSGWGSQTTLRQVAFALAIGAVGYGLSITLWVKGARDLGAARGQVIFASAPFVGAAIAWTALGEQATVFQIGAALLAALGVAISIDSAHAHTHRHLAIEHDHEHVHDEHQPDEHHDHAHRDDAGSKFRGRHSHPHRHRALVHSHPHMSDLHHRHEHD